MNTRAPALDQGDSAGLSRGRDAGVIPPRGPLPVKHTADVRRACTSEVGGSIPSTGLKVGGI